MVNNKVFLRILLFTMLLGVSTMAVEAADKKEFVRVALFIDTGKGYRGTIPMVTVESQGVNIYGSQLKVPVYQQTEPGAFRVSPDGAYLMIKQTESLSDAQRIAQQLSQNKITSEIIHQGNKYQVISGSFLKPEQIQMTKQQIEQSIASPPLLKGTLRLEIGKFPDLKAALQKARELSNKGFEAHSVITTDPNLSYRVWVGNETSIETLIQLKLKLAAVVPENSIQQASSETPYLLIKESIYNPDKIYHFYFSPGATFRTESSLLDGTLKVVERENRSYRGIMEFSVYNQTFTVINELPLNQYLYSVVGSEMGLQGWPGEALKAQAILARTRVIGGGLKYGIANLSDSTYDQAYYGVTKESNDTRKAVDETTSLIVRYNGKPIETLYYSNAGGKTAQGVEVWGNSLPYIQSVDSLDNLPQQTAPKWYLIGTRDQQFGYVRADYITKSQEKNSAGFSYGTVNTEGLNFRTGPSTSYHSIKARLMKGEQVTVLIEETEDNAYIWSRGPYSSTQIQQMLKLSTPVTSLTVTKRGPSERVVEMAANNSIIPVNYPDTYRSLFNSGSNSLRSTLFDVVETGGFTMVGANGKISKRTGNTPVSVITGNQQSSQLIEEPTFLSLGAKDKVSILSQDFNYRFMGKGFGHGMGLSQFGAKMMALNGYDYRQILSHYYKDITIE